jgi:ElaB/YqjD/DUF883 family membrane-anchored ribosome-binding protein
MNESKPTVKDSVSTLKDNASALKDSVSTLVDQGTATASAIKSRVGDVADQVKESGAAAFARATSLVEEHPFKSLAIAFGAGYVMMRIRTSPMIKLALLGGLAYLGTQVVRR